MKFFSLSDYDMAYLDIGTGAPTVCIHGSLNDFRSWVAVMKPLSVNRRLLALSLRHFFPEHWDGKNGKFSIAQHVDDVIAFIEGLKLGAVDLIGHSRGGHVAFRLAQKRPNLIRKLVLAEPGGALDETLVAELGVSVPPSASSRAFVTQASEKIAAGDLEGGLRTYIEAVNGAGSWERLAATERQMRRDNAYTLLAQVNEGRQPYSKADAESLNLPTLFVIGANTPGRLPQISKALAAHVSGSQTVIIPEATHAMFRDQPAAFCDAVLKFLVE